MRLSHLAADERRAYILADNQLAAKAGWDRDLLANELQALIDVEFDLDLAGFDTGEIDLILEEADEKSGKGGEPEASVPPVQLPVISRLGDVWQLGAHRIICGDARDEEVYRALLGSEQAGLVFTDPPYNVPIDGHVCGLGSVKHREFAMASGEMSKGEFTAFLSGFLSAATLSCRDGAILFICMDWRHLRELLAAGDEAGLELKNLCVWNKNNGGMGIFYRSKHELVFVWKHGTAPHINTFELGQSGRYRTNVWDYAGVNTLKREPPRRARDASDREAGAARRRCDQGCSSRGDIVLDPFCGVRHHDHRGREVPAGARGQSRSTHSMSMWPSAGGRRPRGNMRFTRTRARPSRTSRRSAAARTITC